LALGEDADKRLVAYVVADASPDLATTLREHLGTRLPDYMVPAVFVRMDVFPLTPNGKLDRRALPAPADTPTAAERVKPRSASEALVVAAFNDVLERSDVGVFDNFFDLGGHSLLAAHMIANLRASTKVDLPLRNLFEQPTPERLAAAIDALAWAAGGSDRPTASEQGDREEIEL
ncbi:MAG: phosphopantetheine-binding protein, partial [Gammaproteobacteria bacterium]